MQCIKLYFACALGYIRLMYKEIPGYLGLYRVAACGCLQVYKKHSGAWVTKRVGFNRDGYARVCLYRGGQRKTWALHRLVMLTYVGPSHLDVNHINSSPGDNRLVNLEYVTKSQNIQHAILHGKMLSKLYCPLPYLNPKKQFTYAELYYIRESTKTNQELADMYNTPPYRLLR